MNVDNVDTSVDERSGNDRLKRAEGLWRRAWLVPELSTYERPWRWGAWVVAAVGLLSVPWLLVGNRDALAVGVGVFAGAIALEAIGAEIAATRLGLAQVLHVVAIVAMCGLIGIYIWRNPFDWDGSRWAPFAILGGGLLLRSCWEAWRDSAPAGRRPSTEA